MAAANTSCYHTICILQTINILDTHSNTQTPTTCIADMSRDDTFTNIPAKEEVRTTLLMVPFDLATLSIQQNRTADEHVIMEQQLV